MRAINVDNPALKDILWHNMRKDLENYIPQISGTKLLMCPACCRFLPFEQFNVEHIIPQQSLADDPGDVRAAISKNLRSSITLLCNKQIYVKGKIVYANGCNSWKGRFFDKFLREIFNGRVLDHRVKVSSRHQIALFSASYLALFNTYGYQITLTESGVMMRRQFFNPNKFDKNIPIKCQMMMMGAPPTKYDGNQTKYWAPPFKFSIESNFCTVVVRNASIYLPLSRDPELPIVHQLPFAPPKYMLRPNFTTAFH